MDQLLQQQILDFARAFSRACDTDSSIRTNDLGDVVVAFSRPGTGAERLGEVLKESLWAIFEFQAYSYPSSFHRANVHLPGVKLLKGTK